MPAEIVNLNKARKAKARLEKDKQAQENRAKSGQSKVARTQEILRQSQRDKLLDGAKRDSSGLSDDNSGDTGGKNTKDSGTKP